MTTCDQLAVEWPVRYPRPSAQTQRQHAASVRAWGKENAGVPLEGYTREMARSWGLAHPWQIKYLRAMMNDALRDGLVSSNPFSGLRITQPRRERYFPSEDEVQALIRAAEEPLRGRIRFSAYTGLRLGEMLAVRPRDISENGQTRVHVHCQRRPDGTLGPPKGKLEEWSAVLPGEARKGVLPLMLESYPTEPLWPLTRYEHNKEWNALRKRLELPESFVWHSLRHHAATWFLDQGASFEDVAIQLGHSDEGVQVRETYGHRDRSKALDRLEEVVSC